MWIEINGMLINFDQVLKIQPVRSKKKLIFTTPNKTLNISFSKTAEMDQAYFNLLEMLNSKPVDGFKKISKK